MTAEEYVELDSEGEEQWGVGDVICLSYEFLGRM